METPETTSPISPHEAAEACARYMARSSKITLVDKKGITDCARVFADAFSKYPLYYDYLGKENYDMRAATAVFKATIQFAGDDALTFLHESGKGSCMLTPPYAKTSAFKRIVTAIPLLLQVLRRPEIMKLDDYEKYSDKVRAELGCDDVWYLYLLGVKQGCQGRGIAKEMTTPFFNWLDETGQDCYLETNTEANEVLYEKGFGFETIRKSTVPDSGLLFIGMLRKALPR